MSPLKGLYCISSNAARSSRWLLAGVFANSFSARLASRSVQIMEEFFERYEVAVLDFGATFADRGTFCFGRLDHRVAGFKILAPSLAEQLAAGAVLDRKSTRLNSSHLGISY